MFTNVKENDALPVNEKAQISTINTIYKMHTRSPQRE
jgi:hypothetical protein